MDQLKIVPTEMEARMLLREVERRMEDERALDDWRDMARRRRPHAGVRVGLLAAAVVTVLALMRPEGKPGWIPMALFALAFVVLMQGIEIGRLLKVTAALARMLERTSPAAPLPRAPSPPAG